MDEVDFISPIGLITVRRMENRTNHQGWLRRAQAVVALSAALGCVNVALANVEILGTPMASGTVKAWGNAFNTQADVDVSYVDAMEEVSTVELYAGLYDLALVEFPFTEYRLKTQGLVQFPLLATGVAVVVNLPGVDASRLRLNAPVLAAIYMGKITSWHDARITELNPGLSLPNIPIIPVAQSDGSIATYNFTRYLAAGSAAWRQQIGLGSGLIWPLGKGDKDAGAASARLQSTAGAVGFQPWNNVQRLNLAAVQLQNPEGVYVKPGIDAFAKTFRIYLSRQPTGFASPVNGKGTDSWPILAVVYGQMKEIPEDIPDALETLQMLKYVLQNRVPPAPGFISVTYDDVAAQLGRVQTSKKFGPPSKKGGS